MTILFFSNTKWSTMSTVLIWSHYVELLPLNDNNEINYINFRFK